MCTVCGCGTATQESEKTHRRERHRAKRTLITHDAHPRACITTMTIRTIIA